MALKRSYRILRGIIRLFTPTMTTEWEVPYDGAPCVFCPNHARAAGPVDMCVYFDHRDTIRPWYNAGVIDRKGLPAYVRNDNWWNPKSFLAPLWNATIPYIVSWVLPPIILSTPGIPVYYDMRVMTTMRQSVEALKSGDSLVIFAQFPDGYKSHSEQLSKGFLQIAPLAWKRAGIRLKFYPVHIDKKKRKILVQKPVEFDPERTLAEQEEELLQVLNKGIWDDD